MTDNGTLRDHLADVINERNELLRKIELLEAQIYKQGLQIGFMERQHAELMEYSIKVEMEYSIKVESDRNRWRATAEVLARELGKVEYANAEYHNQEGLH